jgi:hypothetical protein
MDGVSTSRAAVLDILFHLLSSSEHRQAVDLAAVTSDAYRCLVKFHRSQRRAAAFFETNGNATAPISAILELRSNHSVPHASRQGIHVG